MFGIEKHWSKNRVPRDRTTTKLTKLTCLNFFTIYFKLYQFLKYNNFLVIYLYYSVFLCVQFKKKYFNFKYIYLHTNLNIKKQTYCLFLIINNFNVSYELLKNINLVTNLMFSYFCTINFLSKLLLKFVRILNLFLKKFLSFLLSLNIFQKQTCLKVLEKIVTL